ncbi:hypothetical protein P3S68_000714 [Capsicum galapagoense]
MELHAFVKQFSYRTERSNARRINKLKIFKILKYCDIHTYSIKDQVYARRQGMTKVVAGPILGNYVDTKRIYTPNDIVSDMMREHGILLNYHQAWRAKIKAVNILRDDLTQSYQKIPGTRILQANCCSRWGSSKSSLRWNYTDCEHVGSRR